MAISASCIIAFLPGFVEINLVWLRNTIRAGGAVAVFLLIYFKNPPHFVNYAAIQQLMGKWKYETTTLNGPFPYGGFRHGGTCFIGMGETDFGNGLYLTGTREWTMENNKRIALITPSAWSSNTGNIAGYDKIIYQYKTADSGKIYEGFSCLQIVRDFQNEIIELRGYFFRIDSPYNYGIVTMRRDQELKKLNAKL